MKLEIKKIAPDLEEEVLIKCHDPKAEWVDSIKQLQGGEKEFIGKIDEQIHRLKQNEIYYFEVMEGKSFFYSADQVYESRLKLYEFEEQCRGTAFFRASKSMILNSDKIDYIIPSISGRFEAVLLNGEKVVVSRQYVSVLKEKLGL